jgi:hypothetical protein
MKKNVLNFEEAISLFHVGAYGFTFQSQRGDEFTSSFDNQERLVISPVAIEEGKTE